MSFDDADHHVASLRFCCTRRGQHRISLADAWCHAEKDLELAALLLRGKLQTGPLTRHGAACGLPDQACLSVFPSQLRVEFKIKKQNVDARFPDDAEQRLFGDFLDDTLDFFLGQASRAGNARDLTPGVVD